MLNAKKYAGQIYIGPDDVRTPRRETIEEVFPGNYDKLVLRFKSGDRLSLNATNTRAVIREYGDDADQWSGCTVELSFTRVDFRGEPTDSVLLTPVPRKAPVVDRGDRPLSNDPDDQIPF
jgi:hypothetical protein